MMTVEQMMSVHRANVETLFGLGSTAFTGIEQFIELNVEATKAAMNDAAGTAQALFAVKDPQEFVAVQAALVQPVAEKLAAYGRSVYEIAATTGSEVNRVAEATVADAQGKFMAVVDNAVKNAPAGTENAIALVKSAVAAANNAYESASKAAKQAADVTDANLKAMSATAVRATKAKRAA
jgi:phasin family protein